MVTPTCTTTPIAFCSRDPIGFKGRSQCLYAYVQSRPLKFMDPSGLELNPSTRQIQAAWGNCKWACRGMLCDFIEGFGSQKIKARLGQIVNSSNELSLTNLDYPVFERNNRPPGVSDEDWEHWVNANIGPDGNVKNNQALHSAIRHCIASGLLANEYGCKCSKCIGEWREYVDVHDDPIGTQAIMRNIQAQLYNNSQGRQCGGCHKNDAMRTGRWGERGMTSCCTRKVLAGDLDIAVEGTEPFGSGTPIIAIPSVAGPRPSAPPSPCGPGYIYVPGYGCMSSGVMI
ncbi:hypothetical protein Q31a_13820 [Aureliella helgolandensis]|uniref:Uncharacterized protein n=1 Tax=Aureliella helgolandensis TaxID=2527968 RepID=A0A518G3A0_9BACT|nr:hypothetical protein Q31a_13820 [Aureliella helgolandensis]